MGCTASSMYKIARKKKKNIPLVTIFVPPLRVPVQSDDVPKMLRGLIPKHLVDKITSLRNQIVFVAQDTGGNAVQELQGALEEYLPLIVGLTKRENGVRELVEFKWKNIEDGKHVQVCVKDSWFELLSVVHMMATLTLREANSKLISKDPTSDRVVTSDSMSNAVDLLLKAAGYLEFCMRDVLVHIPADIKSKMPGDLQEDVIGAMSIQALAQGTEMQLGLAVENRNATLPVKRRLACEQLSYLGQAHFPLSKCIDNGNRKKHLLFIKWKYLEAKAAAYYYNGLIMDKGTNPSCHTTAVCCFLAAEELLTESKKACLNFCLAVPITRIPPLWGAMKHLSKKIPETAFKKSQMYGYLLDQEKGLQGVPDLPEFELSLKPEEYELPEMNEAWDREKWEIPDQTLKEHLIDSGDETESD
ncbi:hypothetical protein ACET3Z_000600 [Daucus carota]